jgi:hypothetical protein
LPDGNYPGLAMELTVKTFEGNILDTQQATKEETGAGFSFLGSSPIPLPFMPVKPKASMPPFPACSSTQHQ